MVPVERFRIVYGEKILFEGVFSIGKVEEREQDAEEAVGTSSEAVGED